jgi:hypothetical protein
MDRWKRSEKYPPALACNLSIVPAWPAFEGKILCDCCLGVMCQVYNHNLLDRLEET